VCSHVAPNEFYPIPSFNDVWFRQDPDLIEDCKKERQVMSNILHKLKQNNHPLKQWCYGHYHKYHIENVWGISTNLLDMAKDGNFSLRFL